MIEVEKHVRSDRTVYCIKGTDILHREDGPAVEYSDGEKRWYIYDSLHREDGPAVETANGYKVWYHNGKCHRVDGPALIYSDKSEVWCLNNVHFKTKEEWFEALTEEQKKKMLYSEYFIRG